MEALRIWSLTTSQPFRHLFRFATTTTITASSSVRLVLRCSSSSTATTTTTTGGRNRRSSSTHAANQLQDIYKQLGNGEESNSKSGHVSIAGRIVARGAFGKLAFFTLRDDSGTIQLYCEKERLVNDQFDQLKTLVDIGDILGASCSVKRTEKGSLENLSQQDKMDLGEAVLAPIEEATGEEQKVGKDMSVDLATNGIAREIVGLEQNTLEEHVAGKEDERVL
ncbi:lysine--tRNA ligase, chloroplastic/mitochondrial [Fagus crenata]